MLYSRFERAASAMVVLAILAVGCSSREGTAPDGGPPDASQLDDASEPLDASRPADRVPQSHRTIAMPCSAERGPGMPDGGLTALDAGSCSEDSQCADGGLDGRCVVSIVTQIPECSYDECLTDADCADGGVCACRNEADNGANSCVPSNCRVDADCGDGGFCSPSPGGCWPYVGVTGYYCHTTRDSCVNDSDCASPVATLYCVFDYYMGDHWECAPLDCAG